MGGAHVSEEGRLEERDERERGREPLQEGGNVNFGKLRTTDFICNKRVAQPPRLSEEDEVLVEAQKGKAIEKFKEYVGLKRAMGNLTLEEEKGREEIIKGVEEKGWMLYGTDKSGKQVLDLKDNFLKAQVGHTREDEVVTLAEVKRTEVVLYEHSRALVKVFNVGKNAGENQQNRIAESMKVDRGGYRL